MSSGLLYLANCGRSKFSMFTSAPHSQSVVEGEYCATRDISLKLATAHASRYGRSWRFPRLETREGFNLRRGGLAARPVGGHQFQARSESFNLGCGMTPPTWLSTSMGSTNQNPSEHGSRSLQRYSKKASCSENPKCSLWLASEPHTHRNP